MLRVLIVDDEPFILEMLQTFFDWERNGVRIVGTACNGLQAMNLLRALGRDGAPGADVVVTDIKMPVMDGLELMSNALAEFPRLQFVILSAYSEFHMVEQAFKLGTVEYALKSEITPEQMAGILLNCRERIRAGRQEDERKHRQQETVSRLMQELSALEQYRSATERTVQDNLLNSAADRGWSWKEYQKRAEGAGLRLRQTPAVLMLVRIDDYRRLLRDVWRNDSHILDFAFNNVFEEVLSPYGGYTLFRRGRRDYGILLPPDSSPAYLRNTVIEIERKIRRDVETPLCVSTVIGVSSFRRPPRSLRQMMEEAQQALSYFFIRGKGELLGYDSACAKNRHLFSEGRREPSGERVKLFQQCLTSRNVEKLQNSIEAFLASPADCETSSLAQVRELFQKYFFYLREYLDISGGSGTMEKKLVYFEEYLQEDGCLEEDNAWLREMVSLLVQSEFNATTLVKRAKKFILANYDTAITLTSLSEAMGVNPNYMSRVFSKEEEMGFSEYLNRIRIAAAVDLMEKYNYKLYEVAEKTGYKNVEHFSRMFKRVMGKSPRNYRNPVDSI